MSSISERAVGCSGDVSGGRILAIGDIHGCLSALEPMLERLALTSADTVVTLGDYVDRGPESRGVIDRLIRLAGECNLICLRGNHDLMMLDAREDVQARRDWLTVGGTETMGSYGIMSDVPEEHWAFLANGTRPYWEIDTHFFVHGSVYPDLPLEQQPAHVLYWERFDYAQPHMSGKVMVCGHTSQKDGRPRNRGYAVCIDTFAYGGQWLSCLDVRSGEILQVDLDGEERTLKLDDLLERPDTPAM